MWKSICDTSHLLLRGDVKLGVWFPFAAVVSSYFKLEQIWAKKVDGMDA